VLCGGRNGQINRVLSGGSGELITASNIKEESECRVFIARFTGDVWGDE